MVCQFDRETGARILGVYGRGDVILNHASQFRDFALFKDQDAAWSKVLEFSAREPAEVYGVVSTTFLTQKLRNA